MKVPGTFFADMTAFTRLLRELSHSGDAPGHITYDDSWARLVLKGEVTQSELRERHGWFGRETQRRWRARRTATQDKGRDT